MILTVVVDHRHGLRKNWLAPFVLLKTRSTALSRKKEISGEAKPLSR